MQIPRVLALYVGRVFLVSTISVLAALIAIVALFDVIELTRRAAGRADVPFASLVEISTLKLPFMAIEILPFAVLIGGLVAFWRLTRSSELIVARAGGVSAWQFLAAPVLAGAALGVIAITVISPVSAMFYARAERLDSVLLRGGAGTLGLSGGGLWVKQPDDALTPGGAAILHGERIAAVGPERLTLERVSVFRLGPDDRFLGRIEADRAVLEPRHWRLENAASVGPERMGLREPAVALPTDLTVARLQDGLAPPDTLSFWALPGFVRVLEDAGFSAQRHRLRFNALLALPLLAGTMVLVSAGFSMRPARRGGVGVMIAAGVAAGFSLFVLTKVVGEFGISGALPVTLAAWTPTGVGLMLAVAMLLHLEDG
ncbi:LPS export ABC transporter permease LptG [Elioraea sp.]|uniref:LPS export ABC transporter permease LptG n=1 Tax=Elioraea sp. TaxID=2185103 RepID=UPI003F71CF96